MGEGRISEGGVVGEGRVVGWWVREEGGVVGERQGYGK